MTDGTQDLALPPDVERELDGVAPCEIAVGVLTYNNATTVSAVAAVVRAGLERHFASASTVLINADAGSGDGTPDLLVAAGPPLPPVPPATPVPPRPPRPLPRLP